MRLSHLSTFALSAAIGLVSVATPVRAASTDTAGTNYIIRTLTGSKTATVVTLPQVEKAAVAKFNELNAENDGTLDRTETAGVMTYSDFTIANTKHDENPSGTLTRDEYMAFVVKLFNFANIQATGADGTLSARELSSDAGVKLVALLKV